MPRHRTPPSQTWKAFLDNHFTELVAMDFFTVPTARFRVLFVFVILAHHRRRVVHFNVTENPTAAWTGQQMIEAFPEDAVPRHLIRDRDKILRRGVSNSGPSVENPRSGDRAPESVAESVCGKAGGLHPA
jgi:hypothetical protein